MVPLVRAGRSISAAALLLVVASAPAVFAQEDVAACANVVAPSECRLASWPEEAQGDVPSPFGEIAGTAWLADVSGDAPAAGVDILAVGVGTVEIGDPTVLRDAPELLKAGKAKQAVRPGQNVLVRIVLDRPLSQIEDGYAGLHVATDIDRSRSNNAPAGVGAAEQPFAGSEDVYSVTYATTTADTNLLDSDLSSAWYDDDDAFAAAWASPLVLDLLVRSEAFGDGLVVVTYTSSQDGGYDSLALGSGPIPLDGLVGLRPACLEASISGEPSTVRRLVENGQTLRDVEAPASWRGGATFVLDAAMQEALVALIAANDEDGDGRMELDSTVNLFEDGVVIGQRTDVQLALDGDRAQLALQLGLTKRGYDVLRAIDLAPTGDEITDGWLARATEAFVEAMPPFRSGRQAGLLVGEGIGACATMLIAAPERPAPEPAPEPGASDAVPA